MVRPYLHRRPASQGAEGEAACDDPQESLVGLRATLIRLNQILRGWSAYFRHAVCTHTLRHLNQFLWWRIVRWLKTRHRWRWTAVRRHLTDHNGRWKPIGADGITLFNLEKAGVTRYRYRGAIPAPWARP